MPLRSDDLGYRTIEGDGASSSEAVQELTSTGPFAYSGQLSEHEARERETFRCGPDLKSPVYIVRNIAYLERLPHAINIQACNVHVNLYSVHPSRTANVLLSSCRAQRLAHSALLPGTGPRFR